MKNTNLDDIFIKVKESIISYKPYMDISFWADRAANDLKYENDKRTILSQICDEIVMGYIK
jgi:hypothetical protein